MAASTTLGIRSPTAITATMLDTVAAVGMASFELHDAASVDDATEANLFWRGIMYANAPPMQWDEWPLSNGLAITAISGTIGVVTQ